MSTRTSGLTRRFLRIPARRQYIEDGRISSPLVPSTKSISSFYPSNQRQTSFNNPSSISAWHARSHSTTKDSTTVSEAVRKSSASPDSVWERVTERLLSKRSNEVWTPHETHEWREALLWLTRKRPLSTRNSAQAWNLWKVLSPTAEVDKDDVVLVLNRLLDHWRLCIKEGVKVPYTPRQVVAQLENHAVKPTVRSFALICSAMTHDLKSDPRGAQALLDRVLAADKEDLEGREDLQAMTVLWNSVLSVWAKKAALRPEAAQKAMDLLARMKREHGHVDSISYACVLEALATCYPPKAQAAQTLLEEMLSDDQGVRPCVVCYLHVLSAWSKSNQADGADRAQALLHSMVTDYLLAKQKTEDDDINSDPSSTLPAKPSRHCFSAVLGGYANRQRPEKVMELLQELQDLYERTGDSDFLPTATTFNSVLQAFGKSKMPAQAESVLRELLEMAVLTGRSECLPDITSINTVIHGWAESDAPDAIERAEALLQSVLHQEWPGIKRPDSYTYTTVIKAWARSDRPQAAERAHSFLQAMWQAQDVMPNTVTYATAIFGWSRSKRPDAPTQAEALYHDMSQRGLAPDEAVFVGLMTTWTRSNQRQAASRCQYYFDEMRRLSLKGQLTLTAKGYNALMESKKKVGDGKEAERIFQQMYQDYHRRCQAGDPSAGLVKPNIFSFHTVMAAWAKKTNIDKQKIAPERVQAILTQMQELHRKQGWECKPNRVSFTILLDAWAKSGRSEAPEQAVSILRHMDALNDPRIQPNSYCFATAMNAWALSMLPQAPQKAQELFDEMMERYEAGEENLRPSSATYVALLTAYARSSSLVDAPETALKILNEMERLHDEVDQKRYERPNSFHFSAVINAFAEHGRAEDCEELLNRIISKNGIAPNKSCFNAVIKAYTRSQEPDGAERAESLLRQMQSEETGGVTPDVVTYTTCVSAWQRSSREDAYSRAFGLVSEMVERSLGRNKSTAPNPSTFLALLRVLNGSVSRNNKIAIGMELAQIEDLMRQAGVAPTPAIVRGVNRLRSLSIASGTADSNSHEEIIPALRETTTEPDHA